MAKTQDVTTLSPERFAFGQDVLFDDPIGLLDVSKMLNWAYGFRDQCHLSLCVADDAWDTAAAAVGPLKISGVGSKVDVIDTDLWLDKDEVLHGHLVGAAEVVVAASTTVVVSFALTGVTSTQTATITYVGAIAAGTETTTTGPHIDPSAAGDGDEWFRLVISVERTVGSGANEVRTLRAEMLDDGDTPDPLND